MKQWKSIKNWCKKLWNKIRKVVEGFYNHNQTNIVPKKNDNSELTTTDKEPTKSFKNYFTGLYNNIKRTEFDQVLID